LTLEYYNDYPAEQCERFAECSQLRHLAFYQKCDPFTRVGLKALEKLKELRSLTLGPLPRGTIAGLAKLPRLERLAANGGGQTDPGPGEFDAVALAVAGRGHPDQGPGGAGARAASPRPAGSFRPRLRGWRDRRAGQSAGARGPCRMHPGRGKAAG